MRNFWEFTSTTSTKLYAWKMQNARIVLMAARNWRKTADLKFLLGTRIAVVGEGENIKKPMAVSHRR